MTATTNDLIGDPDALHWANRFVLVRHNLLTGPERMDIAADAETMLTWFACAIETGGDVGAAAERERIRQLATVRNASYVIDCGDPSCPGSHAHMADEVAPFADLLTEGTTT